MDALHGIGVVAIKNANLEPSVGVPNVNPSVCASREDELRVGAEGGFNCDAFDVLISLKEIITDCYISCQQSASLTGECLQWRAMESIDKTENRTIGADKNRFAVLRELESRPIAFLFLIQQECNERSLIE